MSLSTSTTWEVRTAGSDANGSGFANLVPGTSVDYTQQPAAQFSPTDLACSNSTTLTSATGGFTAAMQGSVIQITTGTNFTPGFYQVTAYTDPNTVTIDRNPTTGVAASLGVGNLGGALASPVKACGAMTSGNTLYIQQGTYLVTAPLTLTTTSALNKPTQVIGYKTVRGDGDATYDYSNVPIIQAVAGFPTTGNAGAAGVVSIPNPFAGVRNLILDGNGIAPKSISGSGSFGVDNCKFSGFTWRGCEMISGGKVSRCLATGGTATATAAFFSASSGNNSTVYFGCTATANPCVGFSVDNSGTVLINCLSFGNTTTAGHGLYQTSGSYGVSAYGCVFQGNGGDGIRLEGVGFSAGGGTLRNCILSGNAGYGINSLTTHASADTDFNAFFNNTAGARRGFNAGLRDVMLTADPYVGAGAGNLALNNRNPGGSQLRAAGSPGPFPGSGTVGSLDIGAAQHADSALAGGGISKSRLIGGM